MEKPSAEQEKLAEEATQEQTPTHNLYLCNDVSCQRILKTMLLQKFDDLKSHIVEDKSATAVAGMASLTVLRASTFFEDYLITIVKYLSQKKWKSVLASSATLTDQEQQLQHGATTATLTKNTNKADDTTTTTATDNTFNTTEDNCNLLYLATALNLPGFIHVMFQWVDANPHTKLVKEVDCQAQDSEGYTPLVSTKAFKIVTI